VQATLNPQAAGLEKSGRLERLPNKLNRVEFGHDTFLSFRPKLAKIFPSTELLIRQYLLDF
jgi:hypothetical protein